MDGAPRPPRQTLNSWAWCALWAASLVQPLAAQEVIGPTLPPVAEPQPFDAPHAAPAAPPGFFGPSHGAPTHRHWLKRQADLRYSGTHGRAMGPGGPLRGTSWHNRPIGLSLDGGALLMADRPADHVRANNDLLAALGVVWDFDHYWGVQARVVWSTPELFNTRQPALNDSDELFITDLSALYYPWGDSRARPYYRVGVGLTDLEYTNDFGLRVSQQLFTIPFGVGLKYQLRPDLAFRLELMDNLAFGQNETSTLNNLTITTGLEWRFGGRPEGYWAWAPRGGAW
ncbi:outer membrane beta-barrel protein [Botrimarina sp.]|uniref:outer membrane beta-barrel protein n=1 Tax=Botrimarina sp. TaxID=2795802 RepID=UPI0032EC8E68